MDKLPYDLVEEIVGYVICHRETLIACSQLCKAWRRMLLPHLLHTVVFRYKALEKQAKARPSIPVKHVKSSWIRTLLSKMLNALRPKVEAPVCEIDGAEQEIWNETMRSLLSSGERRLLIKSLHWWSTTNVVFGREHLETLVDVLALVPNVKDLKLFNWVWIPSGLGRKPITFRAEVITTVAFQNMSYLLASQFELHIGLFPCCISMDFSAVRWSMYDVNSWSRVAPYARTLKHLSVQWMGISVILERLLEVRPPIQLTRVALNPLMRDDISFSYQLFGQVGPTLTNLSIGFDNINHAGTLNVDSCVNLVSLSVISVPCSHRSYIDKTWATTLLEKFAIACRLQTITITYSALESIAIPLSMNTEDVDDAAVRLFSRLRMFTLQKPTITDADADDSFEYLHNLFPKLFTTGILKGELLR